MQDHPRWSRWGRFWLWVRRNLASVLLSCTTGIEQANFTHEETSEKITPPLFLTVCSIVCCLVLTTSCTRGLVSNASTGAPVGDAVVKVFDFPNSAQTTPNAPFPAAPIPRTQVFTESSTWSGANFAFDQTYAHCAPDAMTAHKLPEERWYRYRIGRNGYEPYITYRYHDGYHEYCDVYDCSNGVLHEDIGPYCKTLDEFQLWPTSTTHRMLPDMIVDPRDLESRALQCVRMHSFTLPGGVDLVGLRVSTGTANVGTGPLEIQSTDGGQTVQQLIRRSDGTTESVTVTANFIYHPGHDHIHLADHASMSLVKDTLACEDPDTRDDAQCVVAGGQKVSFCLMDSYAFDTDIQNLFLGTYKGFASCNALHQGITQGWEDLYDYNLPGQVMVLGTPTQAAALSGKSYRIEAAVLPLGQTLERETENNFAWVTMQMPSFTASTVDTALCAGNYRDCTDPSSWQYWEEQHCPDYYDFWGWGY